MNRAIWIFCCTDAFGLQSRHGSEFACCYLIAMRLTAINEGRLAIIVVPDRWHMPSKQSVYAHSDSNVHYDM
jgi:hypothetical protein